MVKELKNKPLVEAILEVRWKLKEIPPNPKIDPHFILLLGRLYDRMLKEYPEYEQLQTAFIPDELIGHVVQHRFRVAANRWPLVQVGPGIFSVNSSADYTWSDFRPRVIAAVEKLYDAHPKVSDLMVSNLILRYIDAVDFDYELYNAFDFLHNKLKLNISLHTKLFDNTRIESKPSSFILQSSFKCEEPKGFVTIRFATGKKNDKSVLVWETTIESAKDDIPDMPKDFEKWIDAAHKITDDWFFKMIEGELERKFSDE